MSESERITQIQSEVNAEVARARRMYPTWPADIIHAAALMSEEAGESVSAANSYYWGHKGVPLSAVRKEVIETMAMCWRFLLDTECMTNGAAEHIGLPASVSVEA